MNHPSPLRPLMALALLALTLGVTGVVWAQSKTGPLVVSVVQAGKATLEGETRFMVELRNTGLRALTLPARPDWGAEGALEMRVTPLGAATLNASEQINPARNTGLTASRRGVTLPAGEALGLYRTVKTRELFPAAGDYELVVVYRGLGGGEVVSAPLRVSVIP